MLEKKSQVHLHVAVLKNNTMTSQVTDEDPGEDGADCDRTPAPQLAQVPRSVLATPYTLHLLLWHSLLCLPVYSVHFLVLTQPRRLRPICGINLASCHRF